MTILLGAILLINIYGFYCMYKDKQYAKKKQWRISERKLLFIGFLFGSVGILAGMKTFRHKTKHWQFAYGVPCMLIVQLIGIFLLR